LELFWHEDTVCIHPRRDAPIGQPSDDLIHMLMRERFAPIQIHLPGAHFQELTERREDLFARHFLGHWRMAIPVHTPHFPEVRQFEGESDGRRAIPYPGCCCPYEAFWIHVAPPHARTLGSNRRVPMPPRRSSVAGSIVIVFFP